MKTITNRKIWFAAVLIIVDAGVILSVDSMRLGKSVILDECNTMCSCRSRHSLYYSSYVRERVDHNLFMHSIQS